MRKYSFFSIVATVQQFTKEKNIEFNQVAQRLMLLYDNMQTTTIIL